MITPPADNPSGTSLMPISYFNPLSEWCSFPYNVEGFSPQCFFDGKATLITGRMDLFTLALPIIALWNFDHQDLQTPLQRPVYIKGDACPPASRFLLTLQKSKFKTTFVTKVPAVAKTVFQDFPLNIWDHHDPKAVMFRWVIVNQEMPPWDCQMGKLSRLEKTLEATRHNPSLVILDGFSWNGSMLELKKLLIRMKVRRISVIVLASKQPPNNFAHHAEWDNFVHISPWRNWRCSPSNVVLQFYKRDGDKTNIRHHLVFKDETCWQEAYDYLDFLKPVVVQEMHNGKTAVQIVKTINDCFLTSGRMRRPMTTSNLARLKREWGLRTYRPEKKPRKKKMPRKPSDQSASSEVQI